MSAAVNGPDDWPFHGCLRLHEPATLTGLSTTAKKTLSRYIHETFVCIYAFSHDANAHLVLSSLQDNQVCVLEAVSQSLSNVWRVQLGSDVT